MRRHIPETSVYFRMMAAIFEVRNVLDLLSKEICKSCWSRRSRRVIRLPPLSFLSITAIHFRPPKRRSPYGSIRTCLECDVARVALHVRAGLSGGATVERISGHSNMSDYELLPVESQAPGPRVAFGSCVERRMFPVHSAPTRMGIEQGLRGEPHRGPGCYERDTMMLFLQQLDQRPRSRYGWYFGASSGPRLYEGRDHKFPGPADYFKIRRRGASNDREYKPFGIVCPRFSKHQYHTPNPGPGTYNHDMPTNRHVEHCETFGGARTLKDAVRMKCTRGIPEKCDKCGHTQIGDYYERGDYQVCPPCMHSIKSSATPSTEQFVALFYKVRDCSSIHQHDYPGADPKILLKTESDQRKLRLKEAYLRQYF